MFMPNPYLFNLPQSYLFKEIETRVQKFKKEHPEKEIFPLGIGDTVLPLHPFIAAKANEYLLQLCSENSYQGYGPAEGWQSLRSSLAKAFYQDTLSSEEITLSDGAKSDLSRLLFFFGSQVKVGTSSPCYPAFIDDACLAGQASSQDLLTKQHKNLVYLPCLAKSNFFPLLPSSKVCDLLYICHPNNPTGIAYSREELESLVSWALKNKTLIIFDVAYRDFIRDPSIPKSIYEIPKAKEVAIEVGSFSKSFGFTGVRLGWTAIPKELKMDKHSLLNLWKRFLNSSFNGPANIVQAMGSAALSKEGLRYCKQTTDYYLEGAKKLKAALKRLNISCFGGENAPYLWVQIPGKSSWEAFSLLLEGSGIVSTPGVGFGPHGEGFIRLSAFAKKETIKKVEQALLEPDVLFNFSHHLLTS